MSDKILWSYLYENLHIAHVEDAIVDTWTPKENAYLSSFISKRWIRVPGKIVDI